MQKHCTKAYKEAVLERAAIMEFDGNMSREDADLMAELFTSPSSCSAHDAQAGHSPTAALASRPTAPKQ